jgi:hypothetical protein
LPAIDLPLVLNSVSAEDIYDGDFETRRSLMWTLSFTLKGFYFGPTRQSGVIKFAEANVYSTTQTDATVAQRITVQPGLTANGTPTTDINNTVNYQTIEIGDDWDFITIIEEPLP